MRKEIVSRVYSCSADSLLEASRHALTQIGASITHEDSAARSIRAQLAMSVWSWGEVFEITIKPVKEEESEITVESRSRFPLTLVDWGKNRRNVMGVLNQLETSVPLSPSQGERTSAVQEVEAALRHFAKMREDGLMSDAEYEEKRRALVERL
jgi:hypothetical protein